MLSIAINFKGIFTKDEMGSIVNLRDSVMKLNQEEAQVLADEFTRNKDFTIIVSINDIGTIINCYK